MSEQKWLLAAISALFLIHTNVYPKEVCEIFLQDCPENLNGDTITVPASAVALSAHVNACDIQNVVEGVSAGSAPPSIMFVIDHSASMMFLDENRPDHPLDPHGSRFTVTRDLIDTLHRRIPQAEVGVAVFSRYLFLDHRNNPHLVHFPQEDHEHGSYMPLLQLNREYEEGRRGYQILMDLLQTHQYEYTENDSSYILTDLVYKPEFDIPYSTNINCGFDAAKDAFSNSDIPPENQFIIFLSDGEPNFPKSNTNAFVEGADVPTTFTIFFAKDGQAPEQIVDMTDNIGTNDYSSNNEKTNLWAIQTSHATLMDLLLNQVLTGMIDVVTGSPYRLSLNDSVSNDYDDQGFIFSKRFPLQEDLTRLDLTIDYTLSSQTGLAADSTTRSVLHIRRQEDAPLPEGFGMSCWEGVQLSVQYGGAPVSMVRDDMEMLDVVLDAGENDFGSVEVDLYSNQAADVENLTLTRLDSYTWTASFPRKIATGSQHYDGTLQHGSTDSIIAVFRNPDLPLDTVRLSLPFIHSLDMELYPRAGDPDPQSPLSGPITVAAGERRELFAKLFGPSGVWLEGYETIDSLKKRITWSLNGGSGAELEPLQDNMTIFSSTVAHKICTVTASIPFEGSSITRSVTIRVEPATPHKIDIQPDSAVVSLNSEDGFDSLWFGQDDGSVDLWSVVRDKYGNYIRHTSSAQWQSTISDAVSLTRVSGCHAAMSKGSSCDGSQAFVIASEGVLEPDSITVGCEGKRIIAAGPNPFVPGLTRLDETFPPRTLLYYRDVIRDARTGILVSVESPKPLKPISGEGESYGKVMIYDAVGNLVISNIELRKAHSSNTFGFVWDGVNSRGRIVGAGVYLVRISAVMNDGTSYMIQKKIGVTR